MYQGFQRLRYGDLNRVRTCDPHPVKVRIAPGRGAEEWQ